MGDGESALAYIVAFASSMTTLTTSNLNATQSQVFEDALRRAREVSHPRVRPVVTNLHLLMLIVSREVTTDQ